MKKIIININQKYGFRYEREAINKLMQMRKILKNVR